jgi:hypothetical protein
VKIDVEGHEAAVLAGLETPLPLLSFEFTTIQRDVAYACLNRLEQIGRYVFNISLGEDHALLCGEWIKGSQMRALIADLAEDANSGDVYARLDPSDN